MRINRAFYFYNVNQNSEKCKYVRVVVRLKLNRLTVARHSPVRVLMSNNGLHAAREVVDSMRVNLTNNRHDRINGGNSKYTGE